MTLPAVVNPFQPFVGLTGTGITSGSLFIGVDGQDPQTNPQACFWDAAGAIPAAQPIALIGGYPARAGTPAQLFTAPTYSMRVRDQSGVQVFYLASAAQGAGGNLFGIFESLVAAMASQISPVLNLISVGAYAVAGDGGFATLVRSTTSTRPGFHQSADGAWWKYLPDARGVNVRAFGATSDTFTTSAANRQGIQDAIDFAIYVAKAQKVYVPGGQYTVNDWLHLGYGDVLHSCRLEGDGPSYVNNGVFSGTSITLTAKDRPGLCISGSRQASVEGMSLFGQNQAWIIAKDLAGYNTPPLVDDKVLGNWFDPTLTNGNARWTPYAAIVIDAFCGAAPSPAYPNVAYPAWTGIGAQYNKSPSFVTRLSTLYAVGWGYVWAVQPGNFNGNGDFIQLEHVFGAYVAGFATAGNNQGRATDVRNCSVSIFCTAYVNSVHGLQQGQFDLLSTQTDYGPGIRIMDVITAAGPAKFVGGYCEGLWSFGSFGSANTDANPPLSIDAMVFSLASIQNDFRGYPVAWIDPGTPAAVEIANCHFTGYQGFLPLGGNAQAYVWRNNRGYNRGEGTNLTQTYQQIAHDATAGGVVFMPSGSLVSRPRHFIGTFVPVDLSTGTYGGSVPVGEAYRSKRAFPVVVHSRFAEGYNNEGDVQATPKAWQTAGALASAFSSITLVNGVLTLVFNSLPDDLAQRAGPLPGDILWHDDSRLFFRVRSRVTTTVIAEITTGYNYVGGTFSGGVNTGGTKAPLVTFNTAAGNFYVCNCRIFRPSNYLQADSTISSTTLANAGNAQGTFSFRTTEVIAGDSIFCEPTTDNNIPQLAAPISAVGASSITISSFGANRTQTRFPIPFLIRQPPANV